MLVALGLVVVALLALVGSRLVWSFGVKLGKRRTERSAPATIAGLQAERDRLRAEAAMLTRKMELRLDDVKTRLAEQTAEVSRNRNRIDHLVKEVEKRNAVITEREEKIVEIGRHIEPLEAELASRTHGMQQFKEQLRDRENELSQAAVDKSKSDVQVAERDREITSLRNELASHVTQQDQIKAEAQTTQERLQSRIRELTSLSSQIEKQRADMSAQFAELQARSTPSGPEPDQEPGTSRPQASKKANPAAKTTPATAKKAGPAAKKAKPAAENPTLPGNEADHGGPGHGSIAAAMGKRTAETGARQASKSGSTQVNVYDKVKIYEGKERELVRKTSQRQGNLKDLDDAWDQKITDITKAATKAASKQPKAKTPERSKGSGKTEKAGKAQRTGRSRQNVVSLSARIRALQKKSAEN